MLAIAGGGGGRTTAGADFRPGAFISMNKNEDKT